MQKLRKSGASQYAAQSVVSFSATRSRGACDNAARRRRGGDGIRPELGGGFGWGLVVKEAEGYHWDDGDGRGVSLMVCSIR